MLRGPRAAGIDLIAPSDLRALYLRRRWPRASSTAGRLCGRLAIPPIFSPPSPRPRRWTSSRCSARCAARRCRSSNASPATSTCRPTPRYVLEGYLDEQGPRRAGRAVRRIRRLLRRGEKQPGVPPHRDHAPQGRAVPDRDHRRQAARPHRHRAARRREDRGRGLGRAASPRCASRSRCAATPSCGGMYNVRVSLRQRVPGEARNAIAAVFGCMADAKQVFVFDDDIDVFSDEQMRLGAGDALPGRPRHHRGVRLPRACRSIRRCRAAAPAPRSASTAPCRSARATASSSRCRSAPRLPQRPRQTIEAALAAGPRDLPRADGSARHPRRPRDLARLRQALCRRAGSQRLKDGRYTLNGGG